MNAPRAAALTCLAAALVACSRVAPAPPEVDCSTLFDPPPGAVLLCDQRDTEGDAEVHWRSYGVTTRRPDINEPRHAAASRCGVSLTFKPPLFDVQSDDLRFETFEASTGDYRKCATAPSASHQTVVVISETSRAATVTGRAMNVKGGAVVVDADGGTTWVDLPGDWPPALAGSNVVVDGRLERRMGVSPSARSGLVPQGIGGNYSILESPKVRPHAAD